VLSEVFQGRGEIVLGGKLHLHTCIILQSTSQAFHKTVTAGPQSPALFDAPKKADIE
jgi:hypothetical protein